MKLYIILTILLFTNFCLFVNSATFKNDKFYRITKCDPNQKCKYTFSLVGGENLGSDGESGSGKIHADSIKFDDSFNDTFRTARQLDELLDTPETLVVRGVFTKQLRSYSFTIVDLFKELPLPDSSAAPPATGKLYYLQSNVLLCRFGNCGSMDAVNVNDKDDVVAVKDLSDPYVTIEGFDGIWYRDALTDRRIMIQIEPNTNIKVVRSYAQIVTGHACRVSGNLMCRSDQTPVYKRDEYLCTHPDGCVDSPKSCDVSTLQCPAGYKHISIPMRPTGCKVNYCDPPFLH
ncbi:hypothetical protein PPL_07149 [Heterostelium album PN500]|uniref:Uncharacterized protein n=1 Tax=Heterostelium pallidum (strain ATCC 26659 / Pp 5 / PN500) TaxID=670386 RepID=D3BEI7_HETP5|nr:hypothetical protein PPL_07149 [Heterostelium album PN500]EFA80318.1 hypothetical protein PPL_07149 [Heterostelium album PN500]|eukprot:XP_020432438.1 hypothetical protein PPL_07149 [Heterostelium album PN500]